MPNLKLGDIVPDFSADSTEGPMKFHSWLGGSWAILFSHPADYTPVCTTELGRVQKIVPEFQKRGFKVRIQLSSWKTFVKSYEIRFIDSWQPCLVTMSRPTKAGLKTSRLTTNLKPFLILSLPTLIVALPPLMAWWIPTKKMPKACLWHVGLFLSLDLTSKWQRK